MGSSSLRSSSPFNVAAVDDTASADYHQQQQLGVNNCLSQSPHLEAANTIPVANNLNNSSSSGQDGSKFSMNLIKFPHHNHGGLLLDDEQHHQQQQYSNHQHNGNFKLDSDRTDISTSLAHFNAPLQHSLPAGRQGAAGQLHHHHQRFEEVDEDGGEMGLDEGDKKFNQLQELENSLLMQNLQNSNFLKKLDTTLATGYSASNPDYRSLNRRSGFIDTPGSNAATTNASNYPQYQQQQQLVGSSSTHQIPLTSSSGSSNPFQRMMGTPVSGQTIKSGGHNNSSSGGAMNGSNNYHAMNTSNSSQSIRNTTRSHIITDTLPGPESCV